MSTDRMTRVNELLRREIGEVLFQVINEPGFDVATITVTHVIANPDLRTARVFISVRGPEAHQRAMLAMISKHRGAIQGRINRDLVLKYTPRLSFDLDTSIARGDRVLSLLYDIAGPDQAAAPAAGPEKQETEGPPEETE
jgi:ribosome-binding factor A